MIVHVLRLQWGLPYKHPPMIKGGPRPLGSSDHEPWMGPTLPHVEIRDGATSSKPLWGVVGMESGSLVEAAFQAHHQLAVPDDRLGYQGLRLGCVVG